MREREKVERGEKRGILPKRDVERVPTRENLREREFL